MKISLRSTLLLASFCLLSVSCSTAGTAADNPANASVSESTGAETQISGGGEPAVGESAPGAGVTATPTAPTTDLANPATPGIGADPALSTPPSVSAEEKAPALKPVYPATDWSPPANNKHPLHKLSESKSSIVKKKSAAHSKKVAAAKHGKKGKAAVKKPTKAECKKFAKNAKEAKKHKKELAICKAERKKALVKAKAKRARG